MSSESKVQENKVQKIKAKEIEVQDKNLLFQHHHIFVVMNQFQK